MWTLPCSYTKQSNDTRTSNSSSREVPRPLDQITRQLKLGQPLYLQVPLMPSSGAVTIFEYNTLLHDR